MNFQFQNLLGAPYRGGTILFSQDELLSPVGNRLQSIHLRQATTNTFNVEAQTQIQLLCLSPCTHILLIFDQEGRLLLVNRTQQRILHHMKFKKSVRCAQFSPDGEFIAIGVGNQLQIWKRPLLEKQISPMHLLRAYNPLSDEIMSIDWTADSFGIAVGCVDMTTRVFTRDPVLDYKPAVLGGHRGAIIGVYFTQEKFSKLSRVAGEIHDRGIDLITVGNKGQVSEWSYDRRSPFSADEHLHEEETTSKKRKPYDPAQEGVSVEEEAAFIKVKDHQASSNEKIKRKDWRFHNGHWIRCFCRSFELGGRSLLTAVDFHKESGMMVVGFSNGVFELIQFPGFHHLQQLSLSQEQLTTVCFSPNAQWIAIGSAKLGQLLVWDWRTETYVLKQQGHYFDISSVAYSPNGSILATGADDSKLKIFSLTSGFCYMTFKEHLMPITAVQFLPNGNAVVSASMDGTVRAFDLIRYRNFRVFTSPDPVQFCCLAVDPKGDIITAGSQDSFQIFVWSIKTGKLLDILAGHEGPVSSLHFNPVQPVLGSSSWDGTIKLWDVFGTSKGSTESFLHTHEVTTFVFSPDGKRLAAACLDGSIHFWDPFEAQEENLIEGRRDIARGRFQTDRRIATPFSTDAHFNTLVYSADGILLFAAGKSKFICIYDVENQVLLRKIQVSRNKALDGVLDLLNSRNQTEAGALELIDDDKSDVEGEEESLVVIQGAEDDYELPGSKQNKKPIVQTRALGLSPTGRSFVAATTEGVLVYSLDGHQHFFDPLDLDEEVTPQAIEEALNHQNYLIGLIIALRLRDNSLIQKCLLCIPLTEIKVILRQVPHGYAAQLIEIIAYSLKSCPDLELLLNWAKESCLAFGPQLQSSQPSTKLPLKQLNQALLKFQDQLSSTMQSNLQLMRYIQTAHKNSRTTRKSESIEVDG